MSDEEQQPVSEGPQSWTEDEEFVKRAWEGRQTDWFLQWLVKFTNQTSLDIGVTLTIGGAQISGNLVSHSSYFTKLSESFAEAFRKFEGVDPAEIKQMILSFDAQTEVAEDREAPPAQYLHLTDVQVLSGGNTMNLNGGLWRGKIASIDGFIIGRSTVQ